MTTELGDVTVRREDRVAVVTLERPGKLNALSRHMETRLLAALEGDDVRGSRCVVLTGSGRAFSAGADLDDFADLGPADAFENLSASGRAYEVFAKMPLPTIAAVSGYCIGGGLELALGADLRLADETAKFDLPEVAYGVVPAGAAHRLVRLVGTSRAKELLIFRRQLSATEAHAYGLVSEVVTSAQLMERALSLGALAASLPREAASLAKALIDRVAEAPRDVAMAMEQASYLALRSIRAESPRVPRRDGRQS